jgi:N-acetylmuramoyl-L-alanine amidase
MKKTLLALLLSWPCHAAQGGKLERALADEFQAPAQAAERRSPVIVLDPGHGGQDWGATVRGMREKDLTLAVARKVKERLERLGLARVLLTRSEDVFTPLDERVDQSLVGGGTIFVSLHANQVRHKGLRGIVVYAFGKQPPAKTPIRRRLLMPLPPPSAESSRLSGELASKLVRFLRGDGFRVEPPARADYYVLKNPSLPSILVEMGYLSNPKEAAQLDDPRYQDRLADSLARSLTACLSGAPGRATTGR